MPKKIDNSSSPINVGVIPPAFVMPINVKISICGQTIHKDDIIKVEHNDYESIIQPMVVSLEDIQALREQMASQGIMPKMKNIDSTT